MARMRSLKPEFWVDRKLARNLSRDERMLYLSLWNQADEWARLMADPRLLKGQCFPYDDDITLDTIESMLGGLEAAGVAQQYEVDGDPYVWLPKLAKHQRLEPTKVPSRLPAPNEGQSAPRTNKSARHANESARDVITTVGSDTDLAREQAEQVRANESARDPDESARDANTLSLMQVAGSREHVAGQPHADESAPSGTRRATKAPKTFKVTEGLRDWAVANKIGTDLDRETGTFLDHHKAKGSTFKDWDAAWRTWMRNSVKFDQPRLRAVSGDIGPRARAEAEGREYKPWEDY